MTGRKLAVAWLALSAAAATAVLAFRPSAPRPTAAAPSSALASAALAAPSTQTPRPDLRLLVTTDLRGVLEPCGCSKDQLGGIDHLAAELAEARATGIPSLYVSAGDLFFARDPETHETSTPEQQWQCDALAQILRELGLSAAGMGPHDLARGHALLAPLARQADFSWVASGLALERSAGQNLTTSAAIEAASLEPVKPSRIVTVGAWRIAIVGSVTRPSGGWPRGVTGPVEASRSTVTEIRKLRLLRPALVIALSDAPAAQAAPLAGADGADFIVASGDPEAPGASELAGAWTLRAGQAGQGVLEVDLWLGSAGGPFTALTAPAVHGERAFQARFKPLAASAPRSEHVRALLDGLTRQIAEHNRQQYANVLPPAVPRGGAGYVGSRSCAACHTAEYLWWLDSPHAHAYASLSAREKQFDLACVACHVTGFERPGGASLMHLGQLENVGCESCHGPGSTHIVDARPPHRFITRRVPETVCASCHDREHSAAFDYASYSAKLKARGHGLPLAAHP